MTSSLYKIASPAFVAFSSSSYFIELFGGRCKVLLSALFNALYVLNFCCWRRGRSTWGNVQKLRDVNSSLIHSFESRVNNYQFLQDGFFNASAPSFERTSPRYCLSYFFKVALCGRWYQDILIWWPNHFICCSFLNLIKPWPLELFINMAYGDDLL